jgi:septal ring factor EnvC (AmiA/AmiB activator)
MVDRRARFAGLAVMAALFGGGHAAAQDVRGIEICTVEKQIDRRTSCLQSNVEFLHQTLNKVTRENYEKSAMASREIAAQKAEISALKAELAKIHAELTEIRKNYTEKK